MRVANSTYTSRVVRKGKTVRLTITAKEKTGKPVGLADLDQGRLRHPLFGNRREWYPQTVPTGWFTKPMQAQVKNVDKELGKAVDAVVAQFNEKR